MAFRYHHPWISSLTGILANILTLSVILLISWSRFTSPDLEPMVLERELSERELSESSTESSEDMVIMEAKGKKEEVETVGSWK